MRCVVTSSGRSLSEDDVLFSVGLFAFVAANHFSFEVAEPFEGSASLALLEPADLARAHPRNSGPYNSMTQTNSPTILAIGKTIARWTTKPSRPCTRVAATLHKMWLTGEPFRCQKAALANV